MKKDNIDQEAGAGGNQKDPGGRGEDLPVQAVLASTASHLKTNIYFGFYVHKVNLFVSFQIVSQPQSFDSFHLTQTSPKVGHEGLADQDGQVLTKDRPLNTAAQCRDKKGVTGFNYMILLVPVCV